MQNRDKSTSISTSSTSRSSRSGSTPDRTPDDPARDSVEKGSETKPGDASRARNAFHPEFLKKRHDREDDPMAAIEAEARGPWVVFERPVRAAGGHDIERYEIYRSWEDPDTDEPEATFRYRELALLYAAGLEVGARPSTLTVSRTGSGEGFEIRQVDLDSHSSVVGHVARWDEDAFPAFQNLETLLRSIEPLAQVLDAAGGSIVELLGRRLMAG